MLLRFRTMSAALIAGVMILGIGLTEARADVVYSTLGQGNIFDKVVGFSESPLADESATVPLSSTGGSDLASVKAAESDVTGNSVQLPIHSDLMELRGTTVDAIIPVIKHSNPVIKQSNRANHSSHITGVGLSLLADSNLLLSTTQTNRDDIFVEVKQGDVGNAFSGDADDTLIVMIVEAAYRIHSMLFSDSSPLADPGTLALLGFGLAGVGFIRRIWSTDA